MKLLQHSNAFSTGASILAMGIVLAACGSETQSSSGETDRGDVARPMGEMAGMSNHEGHQMDPNAKVDGNAVTPAYADNFRLVDHQGVSHELHYHRDAPAVVIMTQGNGCPIVRNAMPAFQEIRDQYAAQGVEFYLINSNLQDDREAVAAEAAEYGWDVPILMDRTQLIGESMGVQRTAEIFVLDPENGFEVVYHGPMDDRLTYERQRAEATETYLIDVLDQMIGGEEVTVEAPSLSPGCIINFPERAKREQHANISYTHDVAPILMSNCVECHQDGGIGPWAMSDYDMVAGFGPMIREVLRTDRMPPWHADPTISSFIDDRSLSVEEIQTLVHWVEAGSPRGEGEDILAEADLHAPDWPLGEPDLILTLPEYQVPATGIIDYVHPYVENPLKEDKWIRATTIKVGSRETVHHALSGYMTEVPEDGEAFPSRWNNSTGGYAVGAESNVHPENSGVALPAGGAIGFQFHYTTVGKPAVDQTQIGFYFHDETPKYINRSFVVLDPSLVIEKNAERHEEVAYIEFPADAILLSAFPHAHYRGYSSKLELETPDGKRETILLLPFYDFNWQRDYEWEEPVEVPAGSRLIATYVYDNSAKNFANPDPNVEVTWGEQSFEEMLYTSLTYRWKGETTDNQMPELAEELDKNRFFYAMDDNMDGLLEEAEFRGLLGSRMKAFFGAIDQDKSGSIDPLEFQRAREFMQRQRASNDDDGVEGGNG